VKDVLVLSDLNRADVTFYRIKGTSTNAYTGVCVSVGDVFGGGGEIDLLDHMESYSQIEELRFADGTVMTASQITQATTVGTSWRDILRGDAAADSISAGSANDEVYGESGNDTLAGDAGTDRLEGGDGNDRLNGGSGGYDVLIGGLGSDIFVFSSVADSNKTQPDSIYDFVRGTDKVELVGLGFTGLDTDGGLTEVGELRFTTSGSTTTVTSDQVDFAFQMNANTLTNSDFIFGSPPPSGSTITGTAANDTLSGGSGNDTVNGLGGNDVLGGAAGNDIIDGGLGRDTMAGGAGDDVFLFSNLTHTSRTGTGTDLITDFTDGQDKVSLVGLGFTGFDTDGGQTEAGELRKFYTAATNITTIASDQTGLFAFNISGNALATFDNADMLF
jgi:Ca2+-binding RTX toxin-like protein